jgi:hypothetical protein
MGFLEGLAGLGFMVIIFIGLRKLWRGVPTSGHIARAMKEAQRQPPQRPQAPQASPPPPLRRRLSSMVYDDPAAEYRAEQVPASKEYKQRYGGSA